MQTDKSVSGELKRLHRVTDVLFSDKTNKEIIGVIEHEIWTTDENETQLEMVVKSLWILNKILCILIMNNSISVC